MEDQLDDIKQGLEVDNLEYVEKELNQLAEGELLPSELGDPLRLVKTRYNLAMNNPEEARNQLKPLLDKADKLSITMKSEVFLLDGYIHAFKEKFDKALKSIDRFRDATTSQDQDSVQKIWYLTSEIDTLEGLIETKKLNYQTALKRFESAVQNFRAQKRENQLGKALLFQGQVFHLVGHEIDAMSSLDKAFEIFKGTENYRGLATVYDVLIKINDSTADKKNSDQIKRLRGAISKKIEDEPLLPDLYQLLDLKSVRNGNEVKSYDQLNETVTTQIKEIKELEEQILDMSQEMNEAQLQREEFNSSIKEKEELLKQKEEKISKLEERSKESQSKIKELEELLEEQYKASEELEIVGQEKVKLMDQVEELETKVEDLNTELSDKTEKITNLENELQESAKTEEFEAKISGLESELEIQKKANSKLEDQLTSKEKHIRQLEKQLKDRDTTIDEVKSKVKSLNDKHQKLISEKDEEISELKKQVDQLKKDEKDNINDRIEKLESENSEYKQKIDELELDLAEKDAGIEKMKNAVSTNQIKEAETFDLNSKISSLEETVNQLEKKLKKKNGTIQELKDHIKKLEETQKAQDAKSAEKSEKKIPAPEVEEPSGTLKDLIASDRLVSMVYERLQGMRKAKIKVIAMQLGVSVDSCQSAIDKLISHKAIEYANKEKDIVKLA